MTSVGAGTAHGTDPGDIAGVGTDTFTGVSAVRGSNFADVFVGSANPAGTAENFIGGGGNDLINGDGGFDRAIYSGDGNVTAGINVALAAGIVTGDAAVGTDTLISVEAVRGTRLRRLLQCRWLHRRYRPDAQRQRRQWQQLQ
jgi:Ca2+-binding RTX toxin-like protein